MDNSITLYVSSPYSYRDIFNVFYKCYTRFWQHPTIPFVLSTNYEISYNGIQVISSGHLDDTWVERSLPAIRKINTKYILLMCDDLFINKNVDENSIRRIVDVMEVNNINFCRLKPCFEGKNLANHSNIKRLYKTTPYARNLQIGIFNRDYLISVIEDGNRSAWDIESDWQKETLYSKREPFIDVIGVTKPIISYIHGVQKGLILPSSIKKLNNIGVSYNTDRKVMSKSQEVIQRVKLYLRFFVSPKFRFYLKRSLKKFGISFTTKY